MAIKLYGSVNGQSKEIKTLYGSVNGTSKEIKKLYGSVDGVSKLIYQSEQPTPGEAYGVVYYKATASDTEVLSVELQNQAEFDSLCSPNVSTTSWTATIGGGTVTVSSQSTNVIVGIEIGKSITSIVNRFLLGCASFNMPLVIPSTVTSIGNRFLLGCTAFNQALNIPSSVGTIGANFLNSCSAFNQPITLPSRLASIGTYFLASCASFNQPITLPSTLTSIGTYFMYQCRAMTSTVDVGSLDATIASTTNNSTFSTTSSSAACYTTGITIAGANRAAWLSRFPNRTSSPYRKLIDAGY